MRKYRHFDLDPTRDIDDAIARFEAARWHTWAAGRGAQVVVNGVTVHRLSLRQEDDRTSRTCTEGANPQVTTLS